ncbi:MAG: sialate O-acetylesterase [Planctomycetales bacterium]|nr:sialate O-acetylesterase [Planctomycetales bacterium]
MTLRPPAILLSVALLAMAAVASNAAEPEMVFVLIGQSNMAGRAPLADGDEEPLPGMLLLDADGKWEAARNPLNRYASNRKTLSMQRISPGDGFARELHRQLPDKRIGLVSNARGGTSIEEWGRDQPLYVNTLKRLEAVPHDKIAGVIWHQGEANANDPMYLDKLAELVGRLRADLKRPELPFVAGQVFGDRPVNALIAKLPERVEHTAYVSADGLKVFDGVHFDRDSQQTLGKRYAEAMLKLLGPKQD